MGRLEAVLLDDVCDALMAYENLRHLPHHSAQGEQLSGDHIHRRPPHPQGGRLIGHEMLKEDERSRGVVRHDPSDQFIPVGDEESESGGPRFEARSLETQVPVLA